MIQLRNIDFASNFEGVFDLSGISRCVFGSSTTLVFVHITLMNLVTNSSKNENMSIFGSLTDHADLLFLRFFDAKMVAFANSVKIG